MQTRREKDSFGELDVPVNAYYGVHTCRSVQNFSAGGEPVPSEIIHGMARLKQACALANQRCGLLDAAKTQAIVQAGQAVLEAAGGAVLDWHTGQPLRYGKPGRRNPRLLSLRAPYAYSDFQLKAYQPELL